jgi:hypothetical protein
LSSGAAIAATAVMTAPAVKNHLDKSSDDQEATGTTVVRWNAKKRSWPARPAHADFGVVFLSTNDPTALPPTDPKVQAGDVWRRHPDAEEVA